MTDYNKKPVRLIIIIAGLFFLLACNFLHKAVVKFFDYQENQLEIYKFSFITSSVKFIVFIVIFLCFSTYHKTVDYVIGRKPFHIANLFVTSLLLFTILSPVILHITLMKYDIVSDATLHVISYGYIPVVTLLWVISLLSVRNARTYDYEEGIGYRPKFWVRSLIWSPLIALILFIIFILPVIYF